AQVDRQLATLFRSSIGIINQVAGHFLATRGKKFRPTLLLLTARLSGKADKDVVSAAVVVELIHAAALIHDDSVDKSLLRRGLPTVNHLWNDEVAIIIGDFLYSKAFTKMVDEELHPAMEILARVSHEMTIGEALEFEHENDLDVSEEEYLDVIRAKTASLIAGACQIGASVNGKAHDKNRARRFRDFGERVGMAFQITDDLFDFVGNPGETGKGVGGDLESGKITLPLIHALRAGGATAKRVAALVEKRRLEPVEWKELLTLLQRAGSIAYAQSRATEFARQARLALSREPETPIRGALDAAVQYAVARSS
ncbi:MAG: polyprenyl synthetase family protein, partial [Candidatus Eiseniibacteriota bacterium]